MVTGIVIVYVICVVLCLYFLGSLSYYRAISKPLDMKMLMGFIEHNIDCSTSMYIAAAYILYGSLKISRTIFGLSFQYEEKCGKKGSIMVPYERIVMTPVKDAAEEKVIITQDWIYFYEYNEIAQAKVDKEKRFESMM